MAAFGRGDVIISIAILRPCRMWESHICSDSVLLARLPSQILPSKICEEGVGFISTDGES